MLILHNDWSSTNRNVLCPCDPLVLLWITEAGELLPHTCMFRPCGLHKWAKTKVFTNTASILAHQEQALLLSILSLFIVPVHQQNNPPAPGFQLWFSLYLVAHIFYTLGCGKNGCAMAMEDQQLQSPCGTPLVSRAMGEIIWVESKYEVKGQAFSQRFLSLSDGWMIKVLKGSVISFSMFYIYVCERSDNGCGSQVMRLVVGEVKAEQIGRRRSSEQWSITCFNFCHLYSLLE